MSFSFFLIQKLNSLMSACKCQSEKEVAVTVIGIRLFPIYRFFHFLPFEGPILVPCSIHLVLGYQWSTDDVIPRV